ncbi:MAG: glycoside hydrolase family 3 N-terminal domain-containing protein [Candidatus Sungiibacteriota bacterium]
MVQNRALIFLIIFIAAGAAIFFVNERVRGAKDKTRAVAEAPARSAEEMHNIIIEKKIAAMSVEEKIGVMMMVAIPGTSLTPETTAWLRTHYIGGVILLGSNVRTESQVAELILDLQDKARLPDAPPLFIAVDQEGGAVSRFRFLKELTAQNDMADVARAAAVARVRGGELKALGININFSPVLDIASSAQDFITSRAFRGVATQVAALGAAMIRGYGEGGIIAVAKHFPGHGGTRVDSHKNLPTVSRNASRTRDALRPFREAVKVNIPMVMVGHIKIPEIDSTYPSSLSPAAMQILRSDIGFNGIIITDDLGMGAITRSFSLTDAAVQSVRAGADIVLVVRAIADYNKIYAALMSAVRSGDISESQINQSVSRILLLKEKYLKNK